MSSRFCRFTMMVCVCVAFLEPSLVGPAGAADLTESKMNGVFPSRNEHGTIALCASSYHLNKWWRSTRLGKKRLLEQFKCIIGNDLRYAVLQNLPYGSNVQVVVTLPNGKEVDAWVIDWDIPRKQ